MPLPVLATADGGEEGDPVAIRQAMKRCNRPEVRIGIEYVVMQSNLRELSLAPLSLPRQRLVAAGAAEGLRQPRRQGDSGHLERPGLPLVPGWGPRL